MFIDRQTSEANPALPSPAPRPRVRPRTSVATADDRKGVRERQRRLVERYKRDPESARVTDGARTSACNAVEEGPLDPLHTWVDVGKSGDLVFPIALHEAVGGLSDLPVPGDLLCAALAACTDSTIRVIANATGIRLQSLDVSVTGDVDTRGALCVSPQAKVAFEAMRVKVALEVAPGTDPARIARLMNAVEHCCVVMRTLREGVPISVEHHCGAPSS